LHFIGEELSPGIKTEGGAVSHVVMEIEVECLPKDIPSFIEVDLSGMHLGDIVHLSEIKLPPGVESLTLKHGADHDTAVANIHQRKVDKDEETEAAAAEEASGVAAAAAEEKDKDKDK
jgi:large subunit ribosomal protein L25